MSVPTAPDCPSAAAGDPWAAAWIHRVASTAATASNGPLGGRRFAVKDNIDVAGMPTTAACPSFAYVPERSATVVERLVSAGAVVAGKTNLDQFACGLNGTRSPYGAVPNAFDPARISGGSSAGSAVAVARGEVDFALGTDTAGSGRVPAALNNLVGLKPSYGLFSNAGVVPACRSIDCVSIFAATVADAVDVLLAGTGADPLEPATAIARLDPAFFPERFRYAVPSAAGLDFDGDVLAAEAFMAARARLDALGGAAVEIDYAPFAEAAAMLYEDAFVAERHAAIAPFVAGHADEMNPVVRAIVQGGERWRATDVYAAAARLDVLRARCEAMLAGTDVMVVPSVPSFPTIEAMLADPFDANRRLGRYTNFVNLFGRCAIAVPGPMRADGLPAGITLVGPGGSDLRLADLAQRFHHHAMPGEAAATTGATGRPLPPPRDITRPAGTTTRVAVVGAHLSGMPLNGQLTERGARRVMVASTAAAYRMFLLDDAVPAKPGMVRVGPGEAGASLELEVWELPMAAYGSFVAGIPGPLGIGTVELADGTRVQGFLCEPAALSGRTDITSFGGWRAFVAARAGGGR